MTLTPFTLFSSGFIIGVGISMASMPSSMCTNKSLTYKVSKKVATAYVLKPPPAIPTEPVKCPPAVVKEECPKVENPENLSSPAEATTEPEPTTHRRRRHHRRRYYWR